MLLTLSVYHFQYTALEDEDQAFLPDSRRVVYALIGDLALTARANLTSKWLRRRPVRRGEVRFFGLPTVKLLKNYLLL